MGNGWFGEINVLRLYEDQEENSLPGRQIKGLREGNHVVNCRVGIICFVEGVHELKEAIH